MTKEKFLEKARNIHGFKYIYNLPEKVYQNDYIDIFYENKWFKQRVVKHLIGNCPEKKTINKTTEEFIMQAKGIWNDKYNYSHTIYKNARTKVKIIYDNIIYEQYPNDHLNGHPVEGFLDIDIFLKRAIKKWGNKYDYSLVKFINANTKVKIIFNDKIYEQSPHNHLKYAPERILSKKTTEQFISEALMVHDGYYSYEETNYISDRDILTITCPKHGNFIQKANSHLRGSGCKICNLSKGEKAITKFLKNKKINFDIQKKFKGCKNTNELPFDFYIPSKRIAIEFDGEQHFQPLDFFGGIEAFEKLKQNDKIKNDYCEDNYINLIRIKYDEINIIEEILNKYF